MRKKDLYRHLAGFLQGSEMEAFGVPPDVRDLGKLRSGMVSGIF